MDKQAGDALWLRYRAEPIVWNERMLAALDKGVKGTKWFSLIDKVYAMETLRQAWAKVSSNAGACGVDGITVERFDKDGQSRLLAVKEHLREGSYQPKPVKRVMIDFAALRPSGSSCLAVCLPSVGSKARKRTKEAVRYSHRARPSGANCLTDGH